MNYSIKKKKKKDTYQPALSLGSLAWGKSSATL